MNLDYTYGMQNLQTTTMKILLLCCLLMLCSLLIIGCSSENKRPLIHENKPEDINAPIISGDFLKLREADAPCKTRNIALQNIHSTDFTFVAGGLTKSLQPIADCTIIKNNKSICTLNELDFLYQAGPPTLNDILAKTITTEEWMANNFKKLLEQMPDVITTLFGSITAVIIHPLIPYGFFFPATGAMYISPQLLAFTDRQKNTVDAASQKIDFCNIDSPLSFHFISRYVKDGQTIFVDTPQADQNTWHAPPLDQPVLTSESTARYALASLLFHELAHANDFYPAEQLSTRNLYTTLDDFRLNDHGTLTSALYLRWPLSDITGLLTQSSHTINAGKYPSASLMAADAASISKVFFNSAANDLYSYHTATEDTALLFEELMMKHHFDIDREIAFISPINLHAQGCENLIFHQSARNHHLSTYILPRALFVAQQLDPHFDAAQYQNKHDQQASFSWCRTAK